MFDDVDVVYRKFDDSLSWHATMRRLGEDEHGIWLGGDPDLLWQRGPEQPITLGASHVLLVPRGRWWAAAFNAAPHHQCIYCNVTTIAEWHTSTRVEMIDLDLDVAQFRHDLSVQILDEDEFAERIVQYRYPSDVIEAARNACAWLDESVRAGSAPFDGSHLPWLARVESSVVRAPLGKEPDGAAASR